MHWQNTHEYGYSSKFNLLGKQLALAEHTDEYGCKVNKYNDEYPTGVDF